MTRNDIKTAMMMLEDQSLPTTARLIWAYQWLGGLLGSNAEVDPRQVATSRQVFNRNLRVLKLAGKLKKGNFVVQKPELYSSKPRSAKKFPTQIRKKRRGLVANEGFGNSKLPKTKSSPIQYIFTTSFQTKKRKSRESEILNTKGNENETASSKNIRPSDSRSCDVLKWRTMAELLCNTIRDVDGFRYQKHIQKWEGQFKALHVEDGLSSSLIWKVLKWYCSMRVAGTDSQLPKCVTANMFRGAFGWIKERWEKSGESMTKTDARCLEAAKRTFVEFEFDRLPITVEVLGGLYNLVQEWHRAALARVKSAGDLDEPTRRILFEVINAAPDGISLPEQLGQYLYARVAHWEGWNGDLTAFKPCGHEFTAFLQRRASQIWQMRLSSEHLLILLKGADASTAN